MPRSTPAALVPLAAMPVAVPAPVRACYGTDSIATDGNHAVNFFQVARDGRGPEVIREISGKAANVGA